MELENSTAQAMRRDPNLSREQAEVVAILFDARVVGRDDVGVESLGECRLAQFEASDHLRIANAEPTVLIAVCNVITDFLGGLIQVFIVSSVTAATTRRNQFSTTGAALHPSSVLISLG